MIVFTLDTKTRLEFYFKDGISMKDLLKFEKKYLKLMDDSSFDKAKLYLRQHTIFIKYLQNIYNIYLNIL